MHINVFHNSLYEMLLVDYAFIGYKGSQPMQQDSADGITYWLCSCLPLYPVLYTYVGLFPDSFLAQHTQPHPAIPKNVQLADAPDTWWSLVEIASWDAWVTLHVPQIMPECNLNAPSQR